jgi:hypothetical protein
MRLFPPFGRRVRADVEAMTAAEGSCGDRLDADGCAVSLGEGILVRAQGAKLAPLHALTNSTSMTARRRQPIRMKRALRTDKWL